MASSTPLVYNPATRQEISLTIGLDDQKYTFSFPINTNNKHINIYVGLPATELKSCRHYILDTTPRCPLVITSDMFNKPSDMDTATYGEFVSDYTSICTKFDDLFVNTLNPEIQNMDKLFKKYLLGFIICMNEEELRTFRDALPIDTSDDNNLLVIIDLMRSGHFTEILRILKPNPCHCNL
jgi:hypothetical protein